MKRFNALKVSAKILLGFGFAAAITGVVGYFGVSATLDLSRMLSAMYTDKLTPVADVSNANMQAIFARETFMVTSALSALSATSKACLTSPFTSFIASSLRPA